MLVLHDIIVDKPRMIYYFSQEHDQLQYDMGIHLISLGQYFPYDLRSHEQFVKCLLHLVHLTEQYVLTSPWEHLLQQFRSSPQNKLFTAPIQLLHATQTERFLVDVGLVLLTLLDDVCVDSLEHHVVDEDSRIDEVNECEEFIERVLNRCSCKYRPSFCLQGVKSFRCENFPILDLVTFIANQKINDFIETSPVNPEGVVRDNEQVD